MGYVTKNKLPESVPCEEDAYQTYIIELNLNEPHKAHDLNVKKHKQVRLQFLYREKEQYGFEKFLLFVHQECEYVNIIMYIPTTLYIRLRYYHIHRHL